MIHRTPQKARIVKRSNNGAIEAWFYENPKSIDIYVRRENQDAISCRISRDQLEDWLKRTRT